MTQYKRLDLSEFRSATRARRFRWWWWIPLVVVVSAVTAGFSVAPFYAEWSSPEWGFSHCTTRIGSPLCPTLFMIGAQKGGTTSISSYFHREYGKQYIKNRYDLERHYFDRYFDRGLEWYLSKYPVRNSTNQVGFDKTPAYFRLAKCAPRLKQEIGSRGVRFLLSLRDPVRRSYSWYRHIMTVDHNFKDHQVLFAALNYRYDLLARYLGAEVAQCMYSVRSDQAFEKCASDQPYWELRTLPVNETGAVATNLRLGSELFSDGMYAHSLLYWYKFFRPHQFCIVFFERIFDETTAKSQLEEFEPCLKAVGLRDLPEPKGGVPILNTHNCTRCRYMSDRKLLDTGLRLNRILYERANVLLTELFERHYPERDTSPIRAWTHAYR